MKLVREHIIFEKFTLESDPIEDMGIGIGYQIKKDYEKIDKMLDADVSKYLFNNYSYIFSSRVLKNIFRVMIDKNIFYEGKELNLICAHQISKYKLTNFGKDIIINYIKDKFGIKVKPDISGSLSEKFSEESDPIKDMNIGLNTEKIIKKIIDEDKKYTLILNVKPGNIKEFKITSVVGRNKQHLVGTYFKIILWSDDFFFPYVSGKRKKMTFRNKAEYVDIILKDAGVREFFSDYNWNPHAKGVINFKIKPEFKILFKPGTYAVYEID